MPVRDFYLLSPEISIVGVALLVIVADLFIKNKAAVAALALGALGLSLGFSISLWDVSERGFNGFLGLDSFSLFFKFLLLGVAAAVILASQDAAASFRRRQGEFYALILLSTAGLMLLASARELMTVYLALELSTLSAIALVAFSKDKPSTESAVKYLVLSGISSAVMLYGMAMVFGVTGSTELDAIADNLPVTRLLDSPALLAGVVFMAAGFAFKISSFPFQMWVPDVYQGAPVPVAAFLSVASKAAGFAVILRVFNAAFGDLSLDWSMLFAFLAVLSMSIGNLVAILQNDIRRLLAYSTIAHAGYIIIGLAAVAARTPGGDAIGAEGVLFYLVGYAFTNLGAFFAVIAIAKKLNSYRIDDYRGLGKRAPGDAALLTVCLLSLTGIPPTVGFWAKLYLFNAAAEANLLWLIVAGAINSVASAYFYLRIIKTMYMERSGKEDQELPESSPSLALSLVAASAGVLFFGVAPAFLLDFALRAVSGFSS
ncbi:MAG: NADH-quinone oxidoreductase subunit N [Chloroflexi bacterium]|nr:NADH-quinone oxidoreductase subunit N [Chloroflexota bacterium]